MCERLQSTTIVAFYIYLDWNWRLVWRGTAWPIQTIITPSVLALPTAFPNIRAIKNTIPIGHFDRRIWHWLLHSRRELAGLQQLKFTLYSTAPLCAGLRTSNLSCRVYRDRLVAVLYLTIRSRAKVNSLATIKPFDWRSAFIGSTFATGCLCRCNADLN